MTPRRTALTAAALVTPALLAAMLVAPTAATADPGVRLDFAGRYVADRTVPKAPGEPANEDIRAEVAAISGDRMFVVNHQSIEIVNIKNIRKPMQLSLVDLSGYGGSITSVAAHDDLIAVAVPASVRTDPGTIVFLDREGAIVDEVTVGSLPDMVTFDDRGRRVVVANEGEPSGYGAGYVDPDGTVTIIDIAKSRGVLSFTPRTVTFVEGDVDVETENYVRTFPEAKSFAADVEPEYITINGDRAFVSLQENNAIAEIDLSSGKVVAIRGLEFKDHSLSGNGLDASDKDNAINIANWPVYGMPMPDGIASFVASGKTYVITANEGDARDYPGLKEEKAVSALTLDATAFPTATELKMPEQLGRLTVSTNGADTGMDGDTDRLFAFGTRSVSIWDANGGLVWDSGDTLERQTALALPLYFNSNSTSSTADNRSDNKGPEPEGVAVGEVGGRLLAFVGLERIGGMAVFDVTNPAEATFVEYVTTRDFNAVATDGSTDSGPEVVTFLAADESPTRKPLVMVTNEVSGSVVFWTPKP